MLYTFRFEGKKHAYDSVSGAVIQPDALTYKMMGAILPPLTPTCPTSLRYELAKFDSMDVAEAYERLYDLAEKGVLYCPEDGFIRVQTDGEYAFASTALISAALNEAFSQTTDSLRFEALGEKADEAKKVAEELAARLGKNIKF